MPKRKGGTMMTITGEMPVPASVAQRRRDNIAADRRARRKILDRTAAGQRRFDAIAAGADMRDMVGIPSITGLAPVGVVKVAKGRRPARAPAALPAQPDQAFMDRMQAPPKPSKRVRPRDKVTPVRTDAL